MTPGVTDATNTYMSNAADLLTAAEVAAEYRVSRMTVSRWVKAGHLAAIKLPGGSLRFRRADVEALAQAAVEPQDAA